MHSGTREPDGSIEMTSGHDSIQPSQGGKDHSPGCVDHSSQEEHNLRENKGQLCKVDNTPQSEVTSKNDVVSAGHLTEGGLRQRA